MNWQGRVFWFARDMWGQPVHLVHTANLLTIYEADGTIHGHVPWPAPRPTPRSTINITKPPHRTRPLPSQK
jgi:calcineurin-like phosphoesterase family protein